MCVCVWAGRSADAHTAAEELQEDMSGFLVWLDEAEQIVATPLDPTDHAHITDTLEKVQVLDMKGNSIQ